MHHSYATTVATPNGSVNLTLGGAPSVEANSHRPTTTFFRVSYEEIDSGTTVPANVVDPKWPLPMAATDLIVYPCEAGTPKPPKPPKVTTTTTGETTTTIDGSTTSVVGPTGPSTTTGQPTTTKPAGSTTTVTVPPTAGG